MPAERAFFRIGGELKEGPHTDIKEYFREPEIKDSVEVVLQGGNAIRFALNAIP